MTCSGKGSLGLFMAMQERNGGRAACRIFFDRFGVQLAKFFITEIRER